MVPEELTTSGNDGRPVPFPSLTPDGEPPEGGRLLEDEDPTVDPRKSKILLSSPETRLHPLPSRPSGKRIRPLRPPP